jgi:CRISPR/Cas system-associated exonuclease Cas4 (RecB family)
MIKLSASSIKDFIQCPARMFFRHNSTEESIQTPAQALGSAVHKVVELSAFVENKVLTERVKVDYNVQDERKFSRCLNNFYYSYSPLLTKDDGVETKFEFDLNGVRIQGMMDRIIFSEGVIFDWKTSEVCPENIDNDIQFMLYYLAYKDIFKQEPSVYYISLAKNKRVQFYPREGLIRNLTEIVIPNIKFAVEQKWYPNWGMFGNACTYCSYRKECLV